MSYVFASLPPRMSGAPCQPMSSSHQKKEEKKERFGEGDGYQLCTKKPPLKIFQHIQKQKHSIYPKTGKLSLKIMYRALFSSDPKTLSDARKLFGFT